MKTACPFRIHVYFILLAGTLVGSTVFLYWDWIRPDPLSTAMSATARLSFLVANGEENAAGPETHPQAYAAQLQTMKAQAKSSESLSTWYRSWRKPQSERNSIMESLVLTTQDPEKPYSSEDLLLANLLWETEDRSPFVRVGFRAPGAETALTLTDSFTSYLAQHSDFADHIVIVDPAEIDWGSMKTLNGSIQSAAVKGAALGLALAALAVFFRFLFSKKNK